MRTSVPRQEAQCLTSRGQVSYRICFKSFTTMSRVRSVRKLPTLGTKGSTLRFPTRSSVLVPRSTSQRSLEINDSTVRESTGRKSWTSPKGSELLGYFYPIEWSSRVVYNPFHIEALLRIN